jgi:hypothetical protein
MKTDLQTDGTLIKEMLNCSSEQKKVICHFEESVCHYRVCYSIKQSSFVLQGVKTRRKLVVRHGLTAYKLLHAAGEHSQQY